MARALTGRPDLIAELAAIGARPAGSAEAARAAGVVEAAMSSIGLATCSWRKESSRKHWMLTGKA